LGEARSRARTFASFIQNDAGRIMKSPRGDLIALYRTLISARAFPAIASWPDLYHLMTARRASAETIATARALWREFQKSQSAVSPAQPRRIDHG
jgi:hypothetical protein